MTQRKKRIRNRYDIRKKKNKGWYYIRIKDCKDNDYQITDEMMIEKLNRDFDRFMRGEIVIDENGEMAIDEN